MKIGRNSLCWCGSGKKYKQCHLAFDNKANALARPHNNPIPDHELLKNADDVKRCKESAVINMACLDAVDKAICAGMTTQEIDDIVYETTTKMGGICAPYNYNGFTKHVCTSINDVVCHGIPSEKVVLKEGDIVNVDCSTILNGYFSDSSRMFMIGKVSEEKQKLVRVAKECMMKGFEAVRPWGFLGDMAEAVHTHAEAHGYQVVRDIGGHGVGFEFHEDPWVSYVSNAGEDMLIVPGMMFTIEPMVNMGTYQIFTDEENDWEVHTLDRKPSAQWEIQIYVSEDGPEIISH